MIYFSQDMHLIPSFTNHNCARSLISLDFLLAEVANVYSDSHGDPVTVSLASKKPVPWLSLIYLWLPPPKLPFTTAGFFKLLTTFATLSLTFQCSAISQLLTRFPCLKDGIKLSQTPIWHYYLKTRWFGRLPPPGCRETLTEVKEIGGLARGFP